MYNFKSLNDWEFECLCKDIMQRLKSVNLRCFKPGKDGGVDAADNKTMNAVVVQVKNYNGGFASLLSTLKKEIVKVNKIKPKQYFVCTGLPLSPENIKVIFALFSPYMESMDNIVDGTRLDDFLRETANQDILTKYFKLWIESTNVLQIMQNREIMIDAEVLNEQINSKQQLYVQTEFYKSALKKLIDCHSLLVTGAPGVGKTTTCNMVVLNFLSKEFVVRYSTANDIGKLKHAISADSQIKELIYIDDFLGQNYLELKSNRVSEINSLVAYIKSFKNKYILLNSRITIHNDATEKYENYSTMVNKLQISLLDVSEMSSLDKAKVLYNHLYFNDVDLERLKQIKSNKNYLKIINHKNYNPRLVEHFTDKNNYKNSLQTDYVKYIIDRLDHPQKIWDMEYKNHISQTDRLFLVTLFSITNSSLEISKLKLAFDHRLKNEKDIDTSSCVFEDSLVRLNGSFIKIFTQYGVNKISMMNPSINDYLKIAISEPEKVRIIDNSYYIEQLINICDDFYNSDKISNLAESGKIYEIASLENPIGFYYAIGLDRKKCNSFLYADKFFESIKKRSNYLDRLTFSQSFINLLSEEFFKTNPNILSLFLNKTNLSNLFNHLEKKYAIEFVEIIISALLLSNPDFMSSFWEIAKNLLIEIIENSFIEEVDDQLESFVNDSFNSIEIGEYDSIESLLEDEVEMSVDYYIEHLINSQLPIIYENGQYCITLKDIDKYNISRSCSVSKVINQRLTDHFANSNFDEDLAKEIYHDRMNEQNIIDEIFNR